MSQPPNPQFETLVRIVENFCAEAPKELASLYRPDPNKFPEKANQAKDRAYCHLYLLVKFGLTDFQARERLITDGTQDGGLDAYFIDHDNRKIYLIQSKFHITGGKFEGCSITAEDMLKMEIEQILKGEKKDSHGKSFNDKIHRFQSELRRTTNNIYDHLVVLLANVKHSDARIKKLIGNLPYEAFDSKKVYDDLVFRLCAGNYTKPSKVDIEIYLSNKEQVRLKQEIKVKSGRCGITILFAPTLEIGRVMAKYKNAILQHNPRNFLSLAKNQVNQGIAYSITRQRTNEFAILNNGITILADDVQFSDRTGNPRAGRLTLTNPQIINGGQTAYTLSKIYENKHEKAARIFKGKEVMLKIVSLGQGGSNQALFIENISNSTNRQSRVKEADRRSNSQTFTEMQSKIYSHFGYFFERKEGEFYNGLDRAFIDKKHVISRTNFLKAFLAYKADLSAWRSVLPSSK
jgi:hypothetical protein